MTATGSYWVYPVQYQGVFKTEVCCLWVCSTSSLRWGKKHSEPVSLVLLSVVSLTYRCMWLYQAFVPAQQAWGPPAALSLEEGWPEAPHCPRGAAGASVERAPAALIHLPQVTPYLHLWWLDSGEGISLSLKVLRCLRPCSPPHENRKEQVATAGNSTFLQRAGNVPTLNLGLLLLGSAGCS